MPVTINEDGLDLESASEGAGKSSPSVRATGNLPSSARSRLAQLIVVKAIIETLLVATLALWFYFTAFPPYYRGWAEASAHSVSGWAVNEAAPWERVEVYLYVDGRLIASREASLSRPDVFLAGRARDEWHGYVFELPTLESGEHEARIYAMHESGNGRRRTLQLLGNPVRFRVEASN